MSLSLTKRGELAVGRPLKELVPLIKYELQAGDAAGIEHFRKAGEYLLEARTQVVHGEWGGWVARNFHRKRSQVNEYMRLARESANNRRAGNFKTLSEFSRPDRQPSDHTVSWQAPVREIAAKVNVERLAEERQNRDTERRLLTQLSHQLIDIGYKVLAAKLHPDKGGSAEAMARLNQVRRTLKEAI